MERDPYEVLKLPRNATAKQIKEMYKKLQLVYHPDPGSKAPGVDAYFLKHLTDVTAEINKAYEILSDPKRRADYDRKKEDADVEQEPPELVVSDVLATLDLTDGEEAIVTFKVDNVGGAMPRR